MDAELKHQQLLLKGILSELSDESKEKASWATSDFKTLENLIFDIEDEEQKMAAVIYLQLAYLEFADRLDGVV